MVAAPVVAAPWALAADPGTIEPMTVPPKPCRVLVADDQDAFRAAAASVVAETPGFELCGETALCGAVAALVDLLAPDVILLDVRMPDADALDLAADLRRDRPALVVVLVSAFSRDDVPAEVLNLGIGYLAKEDLAPATLHEVVASLRRRHAAS